MPCVGRSLAWLASLALVVCSAAIARAAGPSARMPRRAARREKTPFARFRWPSSRGEDQQTDRLGAGRASLFRRLPVQVTQCDPDLYLFLVRHPEVVVNIWEVMKISNVALERTGEDTFRATDNAGTLCERQVLLQRSRHPGDLRRGPYDGPLFKRRCRPSCVLLLKSGYVQETNGRYYVTSRMDTFIQIDHAGVDLLAKTMQPLVHRSADYNFVETAAFLVTISRTAEVNPLGMGRLAQQADESRTGRPRPLRRAGARSRPARPASGDDQTSAVAGQQVAQSTLAPSTASGNARVAMTLARASIDAATTQACL